jgi:hypothetical protein
MDRMAARVDATNGAHLVHAKICSGALEDPDERVRMAACTAWRKRGGSEAVEQLATRYRTDREIDVRLRALRELGELGDKEAVPVLANGMRALGIVLLGHHLGSAEAAAADHLIYGWIFFSLVIALLVLAGLPFRQDGQLDPPRLPSATGSIAASPAIPAGLALATGLAGPALAMLLAQSSAPHVVSRAAALAEPMGCANGPQGLLCENVPVAASMLVFAPRVTWSSVVAARQALAGQDDEAMTFNLADAQANWHIRQSPGSGTAVAVATWLGGQPAGDGMRSLAVQAWNSLAGGVGQPVVAVVVMQAPAPRSTSEQRQQRRLMAAVLAAQADGLAATSAGESRPR